MTADLKHAWILVGYSFFSKKGPNGLKVEAIAREVNKNKSSFYHHFADTDVFTNFLLRYHLERINIIAEKERQCKNVVPELLQVILEHKEDLLFNRQLRVNRQIPAYQACLKKGDELFAEAILGAWSAMLGLADKPHLASLVLGLTIENFYLQVTEENLTYEWLLNYVEGVRAMVTAFKTSV